MSKKDLIQSGIFIVVVGVILILLRQFVFTPVTVLGHSMDPTLSNKERVIALKHEKIERFDIITFKAPDDSGKNYVKRVIGLPGDSIQCMDDVLYINGKIYKEPYVEELKSKLSDGEPFTHDFTLDGLFGEVHVPEGKYFVLGDNRRISKDSRMIGYIDQKAVLGVVKFAFWPIEQFGPITNHVEELQDGE
ncbi:signal peptidase I [Pilibacter termitis]|uniref:Signal peptidase I n=1 Tax=Pilibacter termitis TaxID=263852 RepID=A0A1T4M5X6_9ENTE|nr:signal peptidase I [Pilibacter termitis]SJZ62322.1 signal peptidase I [Pilibacter termitis]